MAESDAVLLVVFFLGAIFGIVASEIPTAIRRRFFS